MQDFLNVVIWKRKNYNTFAPIVTYIIKKNQIMKRNCGIIILLFATVQLFAQSLTYSYCDKVATEFLINNVSAGRIGNHIYQIKIKPEALISSLEYDPELYSGQEVCIDVFDAHKLTYIGSQSFNPYSDNKVNEIRTIYLKTIYLKDALYLFFDKFVKSDKKRTLLVQKVDLTGHLIGNLVALDSKSASNIRLPGEFDVLAYKDSTKFMTINTTAIQKLKMSFERTVNDMAHFYDISFDATFDYKSYNSELKQIQSSSLKLPYDKYSGCFYEYYLGYDNNLYLLNKVRGKETIKGQAPYTFSMLKINTQTNATLEYKINLQSKNIQDISFCIDKDSKTITCVGLYCDLSSKESTGSEINGSFIFTIDARDLRLLSQSSKSLDKPIVAQLTGKSDVKDGQGISTTFKLRNIKRWSDGAVTMIAEFRRMDNKYLFNDLFLTNFASDGTVASFTDIPKSQTNDWLYISYAVCETENKLFLLYNDHPDNLSVKTNDVKQMSNADNAQLVSVEVTKDGIFTKTMIQNNAEKQTVALPKLSVKTGDGAFLIPTLEPESTPSKIGGKKDLKGFIVFDIK